MFKTNLSFVRRISLILADAITKVNHYSYSMLCYRPLELVSFTFDPIAKITLQETIEAELKLALHSAEHCCIIDHIRVYIMSSRTYKNHQITLTTSYVFVVLHCQTKITNVIFIDIWLPNSCIF